MGTTRSTSTHSKNNIRVSHTVLSKATTRTASCPRCQYTCARINKNDKCHKQVKGTESPRTSCVFTKLPIINVSSTQERRFSSSYFQSEISKSICNNRPFQINKCTQHTRFLTTKRLDVQNRPLPGIFPSVSGPQPQKVSAPNLSQGTTRNDVPTIWPKHSAKNIRYPHKLDSSDSQAERYQDSSLSRRLFSCSSGPSYPPETRTHRCRYAQKVRLVGQPRKINFDSVKNSSIFRHPVECMVESKAPSRGESYYINSSDKSNAAEALHYAQRTSEPRRISQFCEFRSTKRQTQLSSASEPAKSKSSFRSPRISCTSCCHNQPKMVARELQVPVSHSHAGSITFSGDGCFRHCVGSPLRQFITDGSVVKSREASSLQSKGNVSNPKGFSRSVSAPESQNSTDTKRQQVCNCISPSRRRNQICTSTELDLRSFSNSGPVPNLSKSFLHPRNLQQPCRPPVKNACTPGVASSSRMHEQSVLQMGSTSNRPFCLQQGTRSNEVRIYGPDRRTSSVPRCVFSNLELQSSLDFSTPISSSKDPEPPQPRARNLPTGCSTMGTCILAPGRQITGTGSPTHDTPSQQSPNRYRNRSPTSECARNDSGSMEMWGWTRILTGWDSSQLELLEKSWRPSTRKVYSVAWKKWLAWCKVQKINASTPTASDLARFLSDLHLVKKLSYNSILLHKSVVCTLCDPEMSGHLSSHVLVKHILKSIALQKPVTHAKPPVWNTDDLAYHLENCTVNKNNIFQVQRHTAALLLLCSGRRIHDLTLLAVNSDNCSITDDSLVFWPIFGSKTDTAKYRQSGWRLFANQGKEKLDPVFWAKLTIFLLEHRRNAAGSNNLFVNVRGEPKPASRTLIAGWIKSLFVEAGIKATPGSIRSAVASKNWLDNYPLEDILARGNWKSQNTFCKFYQREVRTACNTSSSVSMLFNPTD